MHKGFTIPELLVVIATIAILAAIVTVGYNGTQNRAHDAAVQSDLDSTAGLLESFRVNLSATHLFPTNATDLGSLGIKASKKSYDTTVAANFIYCVNTGDYQSFALVALSKSGKSFMWTQDGSQASLLTASNFSNASTICSGLGLSLVSSGMSPAGTWQSWVNDS